MKKITFRLFRTVAVIMTVSGLLMTFLSSCSKSNDSVEVSFQKREPITDIDVPSEGEPLRIAIGAMITPKEGFVYYRELLNYIEGKLGRDVTFIDKETYSEINNMLKGETLDAAFICSGPYVDGHNEFGLELLVMPQAYNETVYYSYIIVHKDSPVNRFDELKGRTFAFTDPKSNTGKLVPTFMLARMNETPGSFFKDHVFTYAHDKSIKAVARKIVDGAAVDSLIWEYENKVNPEATSKTKIISRSPPYGIPPFVVRPGIEPGIKERLIEILLNIHKDSKGREILKGMMIERFVPGDDKAYDSIRNMKEWLASQKAKN